ncbi:hypothetical protein BHS06_01945 [Myxococcus xanthus]|nr:hypothetical protein BHS06_01945 [Myxococcus xanthus]
MPSTSNAAGGQPGDPLVSYNLFVWLLALAACTGSGVALADALRAESAERVPLLLIGGGALCVGVVFRLLVSHKERITWPTLGRFARVMWGCICWMLAMLVPHVLHQPWISRPGAYTWGEAAIAWGTGAATFVLAHLLGWAVRNLDVSLGPAVWLAGAGLVGWGLWELYAVLTVKMLLFVIAGLLLVHLLRRD